MKGCEQSERERERKERGMMREMEICGGSIYVLVTLTAERAEITKRYSHAHAHTNDNNS